MRSSRSTTLGNITHHNIFYERNSTGRRFWHEALSNHKGNKQTDTANIRQADDILPYIDAYVSWYQGYSYYFDT